MELVSKHLLTVVAEAALERRLLEELGGVGITGYTVTIAHGAGVRGGREGDIEGGNVRIECVTSRDKAEAALEVLARDYFAHYACVAWLAPVEVVRAEHF
jgi:hypothetical protein